MTTDRRIILLGLWLMLLLTGRAWAQDAAQKPLAQQQLEHAMKVLAQVKKLNTYTEDLYSAAQNKLPVAIRKVVSNMTVTIAVDKVDFLPDRTQLSVTAQVEFPQKDRVLFFGARDIAFSHDGNLLGDGRLVLLHDLEIPFNNNSMSVVLKGGYNGKTGRDDSGTFLAMSCKGFQSLRLDADLRFPTKTIYRHKPQGAQQGVREPVVAHFKTLIEDWNDLLVQISLPAFEVDKLDGYVFEADQVVLDFSDLRNDPQTVYPNGYAAKYMVPGAETLWRGVYAKSLSLTLPEMFNKGDMPTRISAEHMLIDEQGISGLFAAERLLTLGEGQAGGWPLSVSSFRLQLEANMVVAAGFAGQIGLPLTDADTTKGRALAYQAVMTQDNEYLLQVAATDTLDFNFLSAKATLTPNSYVKMAVVKGKFRPEAMLHGKMSISDPSGKVPAQLPGLVFQSLHLKTQSPYLSVGYLGYEGTAKVGGFPISLSNLSLGNQQGQLLLSSDVCMNLGSEKIGVKAITRLSVMSEMRKQEERSRWEYKGMLLDQVKIHADYNAIALDGQLTWHRDDPTYGDGFAGDVSMKFQAWKASVNMRGAFGRKDDLRYWFAEGGATWPVEIPLAPPTPTFTLKGLSGAVSQQMRAQGVRSRQGDSFSAVTYVPDKEMGLGVKAAVSLGIGGSGDGEACLDIAFSQSGGLSYIGFYGYASFNKTLASPGVKALSEKYQAILDREGQYLKDHPKLKNTMDGWGQEGSASLANMFPRPSSDTLNIAASLQMQYDIKNSSFHALADLKINTPGGFLQGVGKDGTAGWGVLHFDPSTWYIHLGRPDNRLGVRLGVGGLLSVQTGAYLMAGADIPAAPHPPREVANLLGRDISALSMSRDLAAMKLGKGFALGADFKMETGDLTFLMMYANFMTGLGFDFMYRDYGNLVCKDSNSPVGLNGWYAQGQAYAYLQGELGVKVNLWMLRAKFPIIKGGAAALLQAQLPNPTAFKGYLGVKVNILGGRIKGNMRFKLALGDECEVVAPGASPLETAMINEVAPSDKSTDVNVFSMPQVTFNTAVGRSFEVKDEQGESLYRLKLKHFVVSDAQGAPLQGQLKWNNDADALSFQSKEILPPNTTLTAEVVVNFERYEGSEWRLVHTAGQEAVERKSYTFTTGGAPDNIPMQNVAYAYPVVDQRYFLPKESPRGFIQLNFGQKYLFDQGLDYRILFSAADGEQLKATFKYLEESRRLEYEIPVLKNGKAYTLSVSYVPKLPQGAAADSLLAAKMVDTEDATLSLQQRAAQQGVNTSAHKTLLGYDFATSRYATFSDKVKAIDTEGKAFAQDVGFAHRFLYKVRTRENFDLAELSGVEKSGGKALVQASAGLQEAYFTETVQPLVYEGYPFGQVRLSNREEAPIGVPPVRSVYVYAPYLEAMESLPTPLLTPYYFPFSFETAIVTARDFLNLQSQVVNRHAQVSEAVYKRFALRSLPHIFRGKYKTVLRYVLPDGKESSSCDFYFNNFL